jgi:hypothetical protein
MAIKKITITIKHGKKGNHPYEDIGLNVEAESGNAQVKGTDVLKALNSAMAMVLDEMQKP